MSYGLMNKPKSPGATQRIWEIATDITHSKGRLARRKEVIDAFVAEGGNPNTASTQYYYWKDAQATESAATDTEPPVGDGSVLRLRVGANGVLTLPPAVLEAMGLSNGGMVAATLCGGELRLVEPVQALRQMKGVLASAKRPDERVVDAFLNERGAEWGDG